MRTGAGTLFGPSAPPVELTNHFEEAMVGGLDMGGELCDAVTELFHRHQIGVSY